MIFDAYNNRHPEPTDRPTFDDIVNRLNTHSGALLELGATDEELSANPQVARLCAPLEAGTVLFRDLQNTYRVHNLC